MKCKAKAKKKKEREQAPQVTVSLGVEGCERVQWCKVGDAQPTRGPFFMHLGGFTLGHWGQSLQQVASQASQTFTDLLGLLDCKSGEALH